MPLKLDRYTYFWRMDFVLKWKLLPTACFVRDLIDGLSTLLQNILKVVTRLINTKHQKAAFKGNKV